MESPGEGDGRTGGIPTGSDSAFIVRLGIGSVRESPVNANDVTAF